MINFRLTIAFTGTLPGLGLSLLSRQSVEAAHGELSGEEHS